MDRLTKALLRILPASWRATVEQDLDADARSHGHGAGWRLWEAARIVGTWRWTFGLEAIATDLRHSVRSLSRTPWFTLGAALTFALGLGVNLAVFSAVDRFLFRPLPFTDPQRLVLVRACGSGPNSNSCGAFLPDPIFRAGPNLTTLDGFASVAMTSWVQLSPDGPESLHLYQASANTLGVLGVAPVRGRDFTADDVRANRVVALVSFESWQAKFGSRPDTVGLRIGKTASVEIVGVLPRGFVAPSWMMSDPNWDGLILSPKPLGAAPVARLRRGQSIDAARAELAGVVNTVAPELKAKSRGVLPTIRVDPLGQVLFDRYTEYAWLVSGAAAVVLLMACANFAAMLLARGRSREHEAAIRVALGAGSVRIVSATVLETVLVCLSGAGVAWLALAGTSNAIGAVLPAIYERYMASAVDPRVLILAVSAAFACGVTAGVWPGARMSLVDVSATLQRAAGAGRRTRLPGGRALLAIDAALGVLLVLGATLAVRSFSLLATENLGYKPDDLYLVSRPHPAGETPTQQLAKYREFMDQLAGVPGVLGVAGADSVMANNGEAPMRGFTKDRSVRGGRYELSAGFFGAVGGTLVAGREFTADEVASQAKVGMINPAALTTLWPGVRPADAVGRFLNLPGEAGFLIVGIAPPMYRNAYGEADEAALYVPLGHEPAMYRLAIIRMARGVPPPGDVIAQRIGSGASPTISSVRDRLEPTLKDPWFRSVLLGTFGVCALLLAAAGLYAIASFEVSMRRYEVGVRKAIGASAAEIQRLVVLDALRPSAIGAAAGLVASYWLSQSMNAFLFRVNGRDPWMLAIVAAVLLVTVAIAAWVPAQRAAATDPATVLRAQ